VILAAKQPRLLSRTPGGRLDPRRRARRDATVARDLQWLDEKLDELDDVAPDAWRGQARAIRQAGGKDWSKPQHGRPK
jgi:hypothetical protein